MLGERLYHVLDLVLACAATVITASTAACLATVKPFDAQEQLWILLLPLIGAVMMFSGAVLLNPQQEHRRIVIGRAAIALFFGTVTPSIGLAVTPNLLPSGWLWICDVMSQPAALLATGGVVGSIVYVLSRPFFERLYERADAIVVEQVRRIEDLAKQHSATAVVVVDPTKIPSPIAPIKE
jgi:hypothetical protein